jgi:hypothetical protein
VGGILQLKGGNRNNFRLRRFPGSPPPPIPLTKVNWGDKVMGTEEGKALGCGLHWLQPPTVLTFNSFLVCLHRVDAGGVTDVSEVHVASICRVKVSTHTATHFNPKDGSSMFLQKKPVDLCYSEMFKNLMKEIVKFSLNKVNLCHTLILYMLKGAHLPHISIIMYKFSL